jgi:hypothetical protein
MGRAGDIFYRPWRGLSAARQQRLQRRHDRHGFESRASYQARWLAGAPYADASQCPSNTDLIIWPSGRSVPSLPPGISVCFVGQPFNDSGPYVQVRQR